jgi:hypothetical protein
MGTSMGGSKGLEAGVELTVVRVKDSHWVLDGQVSGGNHVSDDAEHAHRWGW